MSENHAVVRRALLKAGYTVTGIERTYGEAALRILARGGEVALRAGSDAAPPLLDWLVRVFLLHDADPGPAPDPALAAALVELDLLDAVTGRATCDVRPYLDDWYVVSGIPSQPLAADHVLGVGGASGTLAFITPWPAATAGAQPPRVLDLGTGCGVLALHALAAGCEVVATDVNPRALVAAEHSAGLSGLPAPETRLGSLWEPVAGESFDLVVSNPPFVIGDTGGTLTYRDGGMAGDALVATVLSSSAEHLRPGGRLVMLANWIQGAGDDWGQRVAAWVPQTCSAWIARRDVEPIEDYVFTWMRDGGQLDMPDSAGHFRGWTGALADSGARSVGFGWVVLERPAASDTSPVVHCEDVSMAPRLPSGPEVDAAARAAFDPFNAHAALASPIHRAPGAYLVSTTVSASPPRAGLPLGAPGGWRGETPIDSVTAEVFAAPESESVMDVVERVAAQFDLDPDDVMVSALLGLSTLRRANVIE